MEYPTRSLRYSCQTKLKQSEAHLNRLFEGSLAAHATRSRKNYSCPRLSSNSIRCLTLQSQTGEEVECVILQILCFFLPELFVV